MDVTDKSDNEQTALWNGSAGRAWVDAQDLLDHVFRPIEDLLVEAVDAASARRLLDVGCGTGSTTLAVAQFLGARGHCVGIDLSEPMIAAARTRAEREAPVVRFICADAQAYAFEPASFDMIISRFGVMFFDNVVRAFANLRSAATDNAELRLVAWRNAAENPFMTTAERAAVTLVPNIPVREPDAPGQFAFADPQRVHRILEQSGWSDIDLERLDVPCTFPERELIGYFTKFGPVGRLLPEVDEQTRTRVIDTVRPAFDPYVHGDEVRFTAACWMIRARASRRPSTHQP